MESATFRKWLADRGCRFDEHKHRGHPKGHAIVTVHHDGRVAELPLIGTRQHLDPNVVRQICEKLNFDSSELPGPKGRA